MCLPPAIPLVASLIGTAVSAIGGFQQAKSQQKAAQTNAILAQRAADDAEERSREEESRFRRQQHQLSGQQLARLAANGIDPSEGSALKVLQDQQILEEEDAGRIRESGRRQASGFDIEAQNFRNQASAAGTSAVLSLGSGVFDVGGQVAEGFGPKGAFSQLFNKKVTA